MITNYSEITPYIKELAETETITSLRKCILNTMSKEGFAT